MEKIKTIFYFALPIFLIVGYITYYIFYTSNEATEEQVNSYIANSRVIRLNKVTVLSDSTKQYTHFFAIASYPKSKTVIVITSSDNKFYLIADYNHKQSPVAGGLINNRTLNAKINTPEYDDPRLGTREKPIPILYFNDANSPDNIYIDDAQYHKNVKEYLTYDKKINSKK